LGTVLNSSQQRKKTVGWCSCRRRNVDAPSRLGRVLDSAFIQARVTLNCSDGLIYTGRRTFRRNAAPRRTAAAVPQGRFFLKNHPAKFFLRGLREASPPGYAKRVRVLGLPIRNCADISNNLVPRGTKVSAIDVKAKAFFERLCLVPGLRKIVPFVTSPSAPTSPPLALRLFLDFHFFPKWPLNFFLVSTPSNLAKSRYRKRGESGYFPRT